MFLFAEIQDNAVLLPKFHPHFWQEGAWLCCRQVDKLAPGCTEYDPFTDSEERTHTARQSGAFSLF